MKDEYLKIIKEKGEIDFEISATILDLTDEEINKLRVMLVVAIGAMEELLEKRPIDVKIMKNAEVIWKH